MYKPLSNATLERMDKRGCADCPSAAAAIRDLTDRVAELQLAIAQDDKSGECATYDAGQNAAKIRELRERVADLEGTSRTASKRIVTQRDDNARLREAMKDYGRHKNRCGWTHYERCYCCLDDALKGHERE